MREAKQQDRSGYSNPTEADDREHLRAAIRLLACAERHLAHAPVKGNPAESNLGMGQYHFQCAVYYLKTALRIESEACSSDPF